MNPDCRFFGNDELATALKAIQDLPVEFVVSAYIVHENRVCLIDHEDLNLHLPPGGHIDEGEHILAATLREVFEETGCRVDIAGKDSFYCEPDMVYEVPPPRYVQYETIEEKGRERHVHMDFVYFCNVTERGQVPQPAEGDIQWYEMHELEDLDRILPHTKMNAVAAVRELGDIIPAELVQQKGRILVPIGGRCKFGCVYCYTKRPDVFFGPPNPARTVDLVRRVVEETEEELTAQLGYDNDPFAEPALGLDFMTRLAWLPVHIGFSTKAHIDRKTAEKLSIIKKIKHEQGYNLSALVTLTSLEHAHSLEPHAPSPEERLQTVTNLSRVGIQTLINFRPLLPGIVSFEECVEILQQSKAAGASGVVFGAFWADPDGVVLAGLKAPAISPEDLHVPWSPHGMKWRRYEDDELVGRLINAARAAGLEAFESSATAVDYLNGQ